MGLFTVELPYQSNAARCYAALHELPCAVWLDSGGMARYDILTAAPQRWLSLDVETVNSDPFAQVRDALGERLAPIAGVPFAGGALGYWSYDLARRMHALPRIAPSGEHLPDMAVGIYDWALVLDHHLRTARLVSRRRFSETERALKDVAERLRRDVPPPADTFRVHGRISSDFTRETYAQAFAAVQRYLTAGDCYQINLAQCFTAGASGDAQAAYLALRNLSPAPYSAFLNFPNVQVLCASPERFLRVENGRVETRPIKGTRPRGRDAREDTLLADELRNHPKDRAENLMIVDLLRNDLGKSCAPGSVRVPRLFEVESFANVHHLVSTVEGTLAAGRDALDLLRDCFPGGSVTGAPKHRAMQIIEELEPEPRGIYCGAIGYVGFDGNMDTNIAIRTLVNSGNKIRCWAGGGIVADSVESAEYQETFDKAAAMLEVLRRYGAENA